MFPLSLYFHIISFISTPTCSPLQQPLFIPLLCRWTSPGLWSPMFFHHWEPCYLTPLQRFFFLFKTGGIFPSFQSLLPHTAQVLLTFLTFFPSGKLLFLTQLLFSPSLSTEADFCHFQPSTLIQGRLWNMWLFFWWLHTIPQCLGIPSSAAFWECGFRVATLFFPSLPLPVPYMTPPSLSPPPVGLNSRQMV